MIFHCDKCGTELGDYLYGEGGVETKAVILPTLSKVSLPDIVCFKCWKYKEVIDNSDNPK